jgi:hypothetical protein
MLPVCFWGVRVGIASPVTVGSVKLPQVRNEECVPQLGVHLYSDSPCAKPATHRMTVSARLLVLRWAHVIVMPHNMLCFVDCCAGVQGGQGLGGPAQRTKPASLSGLSACNPAINILDQDTAALLTVAHSSTPPPPGV